MAHALGVDEAKRMDTVASMLLANAQRAPGYWIQLYLAMGIATLGLVLDSTAVVIGAMLVSPLMGPIVELGMGFAVGSPLLVLRAALRVAVSVAGVVTGSALLVMLLPFHEVTREIAARAAPTALDLLVAAFCALTAAYTAVRPGSDTSAAAAGTAIGIALVPPLCTIGFGLGTGAPTIAGGAALLFTANLSAILVLAVFAFVLLGFDQVNAVRIEHDFVGLDARVTNRVADRVADSLHRVFGSRYGLAMRILIPLVFLAAVFVPLRQALDDVSWEVRSRSAVRRIIQELSPHAVQTSLTVERRQLTLRLLVVGSSVSGASLEARLKSRIEQSTGVEPTVTVIAMADEKLLVAAAADEQKRHPTAPLPPTIPALQSRIGQALAENWPPTAGRLLSWNAITSPAERTTIAVRHIGVPLGDATTVLLARVLTLSLEAPIALVDSAVSPVPLRAGPRGQRRWLGDAGPLLAVVATTDSVRACVHGPITPAQRPSAVDREVAQAVRASRAAQLGKVDLVAAREWELTITEGNCP
jgi:uncharacterized hydrophobic protein (TIGR00271 family)